MEPMSDAAAQWAEWAPTATTDVVPDRWPGEPLPAGGVADRPMWFHDDGELHDTPPPEATS